MELYRVPALLSVIKYLHMYLVSPLSISAKKLIFSFYFHTGKIMLQYFLLLNCFMGHCDTEFISSDISLNVLCVWP